MTDVQLSCHWWMIQMGFQQMILGSKIHTFTLHFLWQFHCKKCDVTVYTYSPFVKKGRIQILLPWVFFIKNIVFSKFTAIKFETIQIKMTLTENQFLIFFSFSPKLIPFLSSLISNSFYRLANSESLPLFCNFSQNIQY